MTARQRAQVVELLRCAADESQHRTPHFAIAPFGFTCSMIYGRDSRVSWTIAPLAREAAEAVSRYLVGDVTAIILEAAQRVEEGWPHRAGRRGG